MVLQINQGASGSVVFDLLPYVANRGIKWSRNDIDSQTTTRNLNGDMIRNRVNVKRRLDITCKPLTTSEASELLTALSSQTLNISYTDPATGTTRTVDMYTNNNSAAVAVVKNIGTANEVVFWDEIKFPLIEL